MRPYRPTAQHDQQRDDILHFSLSELLEDDDQLAVCLTTGAATLLSLRAGRPVALEQQLFTQTEMSMLLPLLDSFPYHAPYDVLLASFNTGRTSEREVERARQMLYSKLDPREWEAVMRPLRNALARTRLKLHNFGIEASAIMHTGYILTSLASIPPTRSTRGSHLALRPF